MIVLNGLVSPDYSVLERNGPLDVHLLGCILRTLPYRTHCRRESTGLGTATAGFLRLYDDRFLETEAPVPPRFEQAGIMRFLGHAERRIRQFINAKQKLVLTLREQKRAALYHAVTGQSDAHTGMPYAAFRDSGVDWLGYVPEHWEIRRLKWVTRLQRGYDLPATSGRRRRSCGASSRATTTRSA